MLTMTSLMKMLRKYYILLPLAYMHENAALRWALRAITTLGFALYCINLLTCCCIILHTHVAVHCALNIVLSVLMHRRALVPTCHGK